MSGSDWWREVNERFPDGITEDKWTPVLAAQMMSEYSGLYSDIRANWALPPRHITGENMVLDSDGKVVLSYLESEGDEIVGLEGEVNLNDTLFTRCRLFDWNIEGDQTDAKIDLSYGRDLRFHSGSINGMQVNRSDCGLVRYVDCGLAGVLFNQSRVSLLDIQESRLEVVTLERCQGRVAISDSHIKRLVILKSNVTLEVYDCVIENLVIHSSTLEGTVFTGCTAKGKGVSVKDTVYMSGRSHTWDEEDLSKYFLQAHAL